MLLHLMSCQTSKSNDDEKRVPNKTTADSLMAVLDQKIPQWQQMLHVPNVGIGMIENGKIAKIKVYGNLKNKQPAPVNTLFNVASVTKVVFGTLVLKLVQNGDWKLDEPLYKYHVDPDVKDDPRHQLLTTRHVLSQQSGFVNWRWNHPSKKLTFDFDPGTKFNYSGEGMEYLRKALEKKFNQSLSRLADSLLFKPLKMNDTRHTWDGKTGIERFSYWYDAEGKEHLEQDYSTSDNAADDIMTTVDDLAKFGVDVLNGAGLSQELFAEMVKAQATINPNLQQGLAWRVVNGLPEGEYAIQHGGNDIGVATLLLLLPKSKRGLVIFTNGDSGIVMCNNIVRSVYKFGKSIIHKSYKSTPVDAIPKQVTVAQDILKKYIGTYVQPSGRKVVIEQSQDGLLLKMAGVPNLVLLPEANDTFFLLDFDPKIKFLKVTNDQAQQLNIIEGENAIECKRVEKK